MAQNSSKGLDSGFIGLAQKQLEGAEARLARIDEEIADLEGERATLIEQRKHLQGIVSPSAKTNGTRVGEADVQLTRDAVVELIRESNKPMHYRKDIYPCLVQAGHEIGGKDPANTLLSRIINDERLCRIAPGVYMLAEWEGKRSRMVETAQMAEEILLKAGSPLHRNELMKRILKARHIQPNDPFARHLFRSQLNAAGFLELDGNMIGLAGRDEAAA